jgi:hypothetical protein
MTAPLDGRQWCREGLPDLGRLAMVWGPQGDLVLVSIRTYEVRQEGKPQKSDIFHKYNSVSTRTCMPCSMPPKSLWRVC